MWIPLILPLQSEVIDVGLPVSTPERSRQAAIVFDDEEAVSKIVLGIDRDAVSVDVVENRVFVKLLRKADGHVDCIGTSGKLYRLRVHESGQAPRGVIHVRGQTPPAGPALPAPLRLVRAMRTGRRLEGMRVRALDGLVYESARVTILAERLHRYLEYSGFVCRLRNKRESPIQLDLSRFQGPGLLLVASRELKVPGKGETLIYFVFEDTP